MANNSSSQTYERYRLPVHIGSVVGDAEYEQRVGEIVLGFQAQLCAQHTCSEVSGQIREILEALQRIGRPATALEVLHELGWPNTRSRQHRMLCSRLDYLVNRGHARIAGHQQRQGKHGVSPKLFEFVTFERPNSTRCGSASAWLERALASLEAAHRFQPCIAAAVSVATNERHRSIIERRAAGESLAAIGAALGISRERVRQVVSKAINFSRGAWAPKTRGRKPQAIYGMKRGTGAREKQ